MNIVLIILIIIVILLIILELSLRSLFGLGNPPIYVSDEHVGYLLAPNQTTRRFGNRMVINQYSMRGPDIDMPRPASILRILLIGDSVANGGWWTDQNQTISAFLEQKLLQQLDSKANQALFDRVEILNASANSWGPRNELAYLQRFGHFDAQGLVLLINTDDLFATAPSAAPVGRDRNYPSQKPPLALIELYSRYFGKPAHISALRGLQDEERDRVGANLQAIQQIRALSLKSHVQLLVAMTPLLRELGSGSRDYEQAARQRLIELAQMERIRYIDFLPIFNQVADPQSLYTDHIHLSSKGNQLVSETLVGLMLERLGLEPLEQLQPPITDPVPSDTRAG